MIGIDLKAWRLKNGMTQDALALALGVSRQSVIGWERSDAPLSRMLELSLIALDKFAPQVAGSRLTAAQQKSARSEFAVVNSKDDADPTIVTKKAPDLTRHANRYIKVVAWSAEDRTYIGSAPGLVYGGCHGPDERAVFDELCQIVQEQLELYRSEGKALPAATAGRNLVLI